MRANPDLTKIPYFGTFRNQTNVFETVPSTSKGVCVARSTQPTKEYFSFIERALTKNSYWNIPLLPGCQLDALKKIGHPIDIERVNRALQFTAKVSVGDEYSLGPDCGENPTKVAGKLVNIILRRKAGVTDDSKSDLELLQEMISHAYACFCLAYQYDDDQRSLNRLIQSKDSVFFFHTTSAVA